MEFFVKLHNFSSHNPEDNVVINIKNDGTWDLDESNNFYLQSSGFWRGALAQDTHLLYKKLGVPFCILTAFNVKDIGPVPSVGNTGSLNWLADDHPEIIDGEWLLIRVD